MELYRKKYHINKYQYIVTDALGKVIKTDNVIKSIAINSAIENYHPFFESVISLFKTVDEHFHFACINLDFDDKSIIADVSIHTHDNNEHLIIIEDLTSHYKAYQLRTQSRNESVINQQVLELNNTYLKEKEGFKNNFIANFSHQLRNPITASSIFCKILSETNLNSEQKNYLDIIVASNTDVNQRINDILDTASIESGNLTLIEAPFDLVKILSRLEKGFSILATKNNLKFSATIDEKLPTLIFGDAYQVKQIIINLVNNAITFTKEGYVSLDVTLNYIRAGKASIQFKITDTGIGINKTEQKAIFERYTKVNDNGSHHRNIGLGLSIVKKLVAQMKGTIKVESERDKGSIFTCNLSFKISDNKSKTLWFDHLKNRPNFKVKKNVLLIEDSELIQLSILKILAAEGNFFINMVSNAEDVMPAIIDKNIDLILVANTIQSVSAEQIANQIRNTSKELKKIPILALTTQVFKEDIKRYKKAGIKDIVAKPFDSQSLLYKLYKYTQKNGL